MFSPSSSNCSGSTPVWRLAHHIDRTGGFGESNDFPDARLACHQRVNAIVPERDTTVRRRAIFQGFEEESESFARLFFGEAQHLEYPALNVLAMNTDRAAANLGTVQHQIVRPRSNGAGVGFQLVQVLLARRRERVVHGRETFFLFVVLEHRKVHNP